MLRRLALVILLLLACAALPACGEEPTSASAPTPVGWESVVSGRASHLERTAAGDVLVVDGLAPAVTLFTDRPRRLLGEITTTELVALWHGSGAFAADPPNAAVIVDGRTVAVELTGAALDPAASRVRFTLRALPPADPSVAVPALPDGPQGPTVLFVDAMPTPVNGQVTDVVATADVRVLGEAPAQAMSALYETTARSLGLDPEGALDAVQP